MAVNDEINVFLNGHDPMERIIAIECGYNDDRVSIIYNNEKGEKRKRVEDFKPFVWAKNSVAVRMFDGDRKLLKAKMHEFGIGVEGLITSLNGEKAPERLENGYKYIFFAKKKMSYQKFMLFFELAGTPIYSKKSKNINEPIVGTREFLAVSPVEQYMIYSGKRMFKGYSDYDQLKRLQFDLETQGLDPTRHAIDQIGIRTNKGFEKIITIVGEGEERKRNELAAIIEFISILAAEKPDVIAGHNSENFDWNFIIVRCEVLGTSLEEISKNFFEKPIFKKKKESVLKLGGEVEYFRPTIMWGFNIVDSLHAVRRAQAIDSAMKLANLKYVTKYLKLKKENRVYVPGDKIGAIWRVTSPSYAFNNTNGDWYQLTDNRGLEANYEAVSGRYIVERYLLDDIWETDKVELQLNQANFLITKIIPTTFQRACTMGTAGIWKLISLAWAYEKKLAVPALGFAKRITGGLSRLLKVGYADRVAKLDYNSLYPSIILTWYIQSKLDISQFLNRVLSFVLGKREFYKEEKSKCKKESSKIEQLLTSKEFSLEEKKKLLVEKQHWDIEAAANDKKQLPLKILANSLFGSLSAPNLFYLGDTEASEMTTTIGRQCLRLMIHHFSNIGRIYVEMIPEGENIQDYNYTAIVGDTDGFNFQLPRKFRYTKEKPYISNGKGRNSKKDKEYIGIDADICEFEDTHLNKVYSPKGQLKYGLGLDEVIPASINVSRKNYIDLLDEKKQEIKLVGNTIKSRRMSGYIEKFIDKACLLLLYGKGQEFLDLYYEHINKIYNYQIPLKDIAAKGKIKKTIKEYIADCETLTKSGNKKSRQAWYELAIKNHLKVDVSDTVYYVNTGKSLSEKDVKRVTHQFAKLNGEIVEVTAKVKKELMKKALGVDDIKMKDYKTKQIKELIAPYIVKEEDEIILNCKLVPNEIIESEDDVLCNEEFEYNVVKYIDQFNSRIRPLLVCFSKNIRDKILITNPEQRQFFTKEECELTAGEPYKEGDQDTYEALMTPERKEIEFWLSINEVPPFVKECEIDWDKLVAEHKELLKKEHDVVFQEENALYLSCLNELTKDEVKEFEEEGTIPSRLSKVVTLGSDMYFRFNKLPTMKPTTGGFVFDDIVVQDHSDEIESVFSSSIEE